MKTVISWDIVILAGRIIGSIIPAAFVGLRMRRLKRRLFKCALCLRLVPISPVEQCVCLDCQREMIVQCQQRGME